MNKRIFALISTLIFILALFITAINIDFVQANVLAIENSWIPKASMNLARCDLGVASVNSKIYAIGGSTIHGSPPNQIGGLVGTNEEYSSTTNSWTFKASMPTPRAYFATAVYKDQIYCIGGSSNYGNTNITEVYNTVNDSWTTKAPLPITEEGMQGNVVNGKIYLIGGNLNQTFVYDPPTDTWSTKSSMPNVPNGWATSCMLDGKIYVISSYLTQTYYPANDTWSIVTPLPASTKYPVSVATTGINASKRIYVFYEDSLEIYNPLSNIWMNGNSLPATIANPESQGVTVLTNREAYGVTILNDIIFTVGGTTLTYPSNRPYSPNMAGNTLEDATNEQYIPLGYGTVSSVPTSTPSVPEFSWLIILPLFFFSLSIAVKVRLRKT